MTMTTEREVFFGAFVEAAAARAACVTGMCIPRLGRDNDLRRVLYGILAVFARRKDNEKKGKRKVKG